MIIEIFQIYLQYIYLKIEFLKKHEKNFLNKVFTKINKNITYKLDHYDP